MVAAMMCGCEKEIVSENGAKASETTTTATPDGQAVKTKKFTFTMKGDFSGEWNGDGIAGQETKQAARRTAWYLAADGRDMTDVWVLDYMNGVLVQQVHQSDNTAEDFGKPVMSLAYGSHHVYFVASRGATPTLNTTAQSITWEKPSDTFWADYAVDVVATSNGNRAVTLERVVTKLKLAFTDAVSADAKTITFMPAKWYYAMNYTTGEPTAATVNSTYTMTLPDGYAGRTDVSVTYFSLSPSAEWTTDVTVSSKDAGENIIGQGIMNAVPMKRNRVTEFSGPLFTAGGALSMTLNATWETSETGTW